MAFRRRSRPEREAAGRQRQRGSSCQPLAHTLIREVPLPTYTSRWYERFLSLSIHEPSDRHDLLLPLSLSRTASLSTKGQPEPPIPRENPLCQNCPLLLSDPAGDSDPLGEQNLELSALQPSSDQSGTRSATTPETRLIFQVAVFYSERTQHREFLQQMRNLNKFSEMTTFPSLPPTSLLSGL